MTWRQFQKVIWLLLAVCAGGIILFCLLGSMGFVLVIGQVDSGDILAVLLLAVLLTLLVWGDGAIVTFLKGWGRGAALTLALAAEGVTLAAILFFSLFFSTGPEYVPLCSPSGDMELVVCEESWLLGGWGWFYWKAGPGLLRDTGVTYTTDDGFRPFAHGDYNLEWGEDSVTVCFDTSAGWDSRMVKYLAK